MDPTQPGTPSSRNEESEPKSTPSKLSRGRISSGTAVGLLTEDDPAHVPNGNAVDVPHFSTEFNPGCIKKGLVLKQHSHTSGFSSRFLEVHGGKLAWTKLGDVKKNSNVSVRRLSGGCVVALNASNKLVKMQNSLYMFEVFLAYDSRKVHVPPLIFATESEEERSEWMAQISRAASWMYHPALLRPLSNRLCGLIIVEIIMIENVLVADWTGKSDPYVLVEVDTVLARTVTAYEALTVNYSQFLTIPVLNDDPNLPISLFLFDEDALKKDDILGGVSLPLHSLGFNKEIVWDSIPLKRLPGTVAAKQAYGGDPFGSITFRTFYKSSKLTQLLPVNQPRHRVSEAQTFSKSADNGSVFSYEFSIEIFKLQLGRIGAILGTLQFFSSISYLLQFRDPVWSSVILAWLTWILLVEPGSALLFWYALLAKLMLQAHPNYLDLKNELKQTIHQAMFYGRLSNLRNFFTQQKFLAPSVTVPFSNIELVSSGSASLEPAEYRVFECQRRRIANAFTMLSTMVKVPANVAAGAAVAAGSALRPHEEGEESSFDESTVLNTARTDLENLFKNFSSQNLKNPGETEWVSITGVPLEQSPSTIIGGTKIKWGVSINAATDPGGWEYAKSFPPLLTNVVDMSGNSMDYDTTVPVWSGVEFSNTLKMHRHWVRRRVWIGKPVRAAMDSEEPIRLSEIVEATLDIDDGLMDLEKKNSSSIFAKFRQIMIEGKKLQRVLFDVSSQLESLKNLVSWKARWITSVIFFLIIVLLAASIFVPQPVLCWIITMLVVVDSYSDMRIKAVKTNPLRLEVLNQVQLSTLLPDQWKRILLHKLASNSSRMDDITNEVSVQILAPIVQKATSVVFDPTMKHFVLAPADFGEGVNQAAQGGPLTWGKVLEDIYLKSHFGNADWWKSRKTSIHPKNLIKGHLVSDWEEFNPTSLFANNSKN